MKKIITISSRLTDEDDSYTRDELIARMDEVIAEVATRGTVVKFRVERTQYEYSEGDSVGLHYTYERLETDEEEQKREASEAHWAALAEKREKEVYERLKKKFG